MIKELTIKLINWVIKEYGKFIIDWKINWKIKILVWIIGVVMKIILKFDVGLINGFIISSVGNWYIKFYVNQLIEVGKIIKNM